MTLDKLDRCLRVREASDAFSGVVRVTVGNDGRFAGAYGFANRVWRARNTLETRFECGLDREALTDVATLQQVARHPDESASGYLVLRVVQRQPRSPGWSSWS